ncbi:Uncharacterised protein [Vibrio cholerae]|nr:Uncharacterised protein [Vibrio cholerae]
MFQLFACHSVNRNFTASILVVVGDVFGFDRANV